jgi:hypothetical protein
VFDLLAGFERHGNRLLVTLANKLTAELTDSWVLKSERRSCCLKSGSYKVSRLVSQSKFWLVNISRAGAYFTYDPNLVVSPQLTKVTKELRSINLQRIRCSIIK